MLLSFPAPKKTEKKKYYDTPPMNRKFLEKNESNLETATESTSTKKFDQNYLRNSVLLSFPIPMNISKKKFYDTPPMSSKGKRRSNSIA